MSTRRPHIEKSPASRGALLFVSFSDRISLNHMFNKEITLKYFKVAALLALALTSYTAQANDISTLKKSLKPWQPIEVSKSGDTLTVILNENQITPTIYDAVISAGVCSDIWTKSVPAKYLETVKELHILNKHKFKGYVLEQPLATCNEMGKETDERAKVIMLSHTHLF
ncbi:hypothetical protein [Enterobacter hormaechei]|uniref:hypothetical protein n=1 Tax=Enterobacter hormaechei TaxID=158836 RepID=UPI0021AC2A13|nr:hypothetical protein [Enterobacter hormaechei]